MNKFGAVLFVKDVTRLCAFYEAVAGLSVTEAASTWARLGTGAFELVVHGIPPHISATFEISSPPQRREEAAIKLVVPVADIAIARATAARLGGDMNPPDRDGNWVHSVFATVLIPKAMCFRYGQ